jgi:uncharacterized protein DUF4253
MAIALWSELASTHDPGWWPVVLGGHDDEARLAEATQYCTASPATILQTAAGIDTDELLQRWKSEEDDLLEDEDWDSVGEWPAHPQPSSTFALPYDALTKAPRTTVVAIVAVAEPTHVPAALGWGDWNACPPPEVHVAMLQRWSDRYSTQLVGVSSDVIEMRVMSPPTTRDESMRLAEEHFSYCGDIVDQGVGSVSALAATLLNGSAWYFWWD